MSLFYVSKFKIKCALLPLIPSLLLCHKSMAQNDLPEDLQESTAPTNTTGNAAINTNGIPVTNGGVPKNGGANSPGNIGGTSPVNSGANGSLNQALNGGSLDNGAEANLITSNPDAGKKTEPIPLEAPPNAIQNSPQNKNPWSNNSIKSEFGTQNSSKQNKSVNIPQNNSKFGNSVPPLQKPGPAFNPPIVKPDEKWDVTNAASDESGLKSKKAVISPSQKGGKFLTAAETEAALMAIKTLKNIAPGVAPEEYIVQHGDTLWDISDQLLDDAAWWPKLWSLNNSIQNPNLIYPGMKLLFYPSNGSEAPALAIKDDLDGVMPIGYENNLAIRSGNALAENWRKRDGNILDPRDLPSDPTIFSMRQYQIAEDFLFNVPGFISSTSPDKKGEIAELESSPLISLPGQSTYAQFSDEPRLGEKFLVVRKYEDISDPSGKPSDPGSVYIYAGTVGVSHINKNGIVTLAVLNTTHGISSGDIIIPFRSLTHIVQLKPQEKLTNMDSEVIAVLDLPVFHAAQGQAVFLKNNGGAKAGDDFDLFMPPGSPISFSGDGLDGIKVARARVIEVNGSSILAVILKSTREVSVGARTTPQF